MRLKIRCDGESEKFYKIFWELNKAQDLQHRHEKATKHIYPRAIDIT